MKQTKQLLSLFLLLSFFIPTIKAQLLGSLEFNGNNNYVEVTNSPMNVIADGDFTLEAWIKGEESEQASHPMILSNRGLITSNGGVSLFFHDLWGGSQSKMLCFQINQINYLLLDNGSYNGSLLDNECHHVALTRTSDTISFFADGALIGTRIISSSSTTASNEPLWIGKDMPTNNTFNGLISQCRIWNVARTQNQINESKDIVVPGNEPGLLAYWEMNNDDDQIVKDETGQFDGVLGSTIQDEDEDPTWSEDGCVEIIIISTENLTKDDQYKVYPNPTSGRLTLESSRSIQNANISVLNVNGKVLIDELSLGLNTEIDLSGFPAGIYFIQIIDDTGISTHKVFRS